MLHRIRTKHLLHILYQLKRLSHLQALLLDQLSNNRVVSYDELITALWGKRSDGGPLTPKNIIRVTICNLRKRGYPIITYSGRGYSLGEIDITHEDGIVMTDEFSDNTQIVLQFSSTFAWQSHIIRIMCNSPFSHVDFVLPEGLLGASDPGGVMIRKFDYEPFIIRQHAIIKTDKAEAIINHAKSQIGKPFDDTALHAFLHQPGEFIVQRDWRELSQWFCAEYTCWSFECEGFWPYEILTPEDRVTPPNLLLLINPYLDIAKWHASKIIQAKP